MKTVFAIIAILGGIAILWPFREKIIGWIKKPDELVSKVNALISPPKSDSEKTVDSSDHPPRKG
jgi:hypothetical protein